MSTRFSTVFAAIPTELCNEIESDYRDIKQNYALRKFKPSEMGGGHFCETVYRILEWHSGPNQSYTPLKDNVGDFRQLQRKLMKNMQLHESVRFHLPNALSTIYDIRSKRGVAHKSEDVNPNFMDATLVVACADWVMAELVRMLHNVNLEEASNMVESLVTKKIPVVWEVGDRKRILSPSSRSMSAKHKVLILLYSENSNRLSVSVLREWIEYKNATNFKKKVLARLHADDLVHFDEYESEVTLSPKGIRKVEEEIPLEF